MKQDSVKRSIRINYKDGTFKDLELSRAVSVKTSSEMLNLEKLQDGTWRLIWNDGLFPDFTKVDNFKVVRDDSPG